MYYSFLIHSSVDECLGCFAVLANYKQCFSEHWGVFIFLDYGFLQIHAQE